MPYNSKFYNLVGSSVTTTSAISWDVRIKAALVQSLCRTKPEGELLSSFLSNGTSPTKNNRKGTFGNIIGFDSINPFYFPYAALQVTKACIFAALDGAPFKNNVSKVLTDDNNLRIAAKAIVQAIFIIPEAIAYAAAKVGDFVGKGLEPVGKFMGKVLEPVGKFIGKVLEPVEKFIGKVFDSVVTFFGEASVEEDKKEHKSSNPFSKLFNSNTNNNSKSARNEVKYEAVNTEEEKMSKSVEFIDIKKTERNTAPLATIDEAEEEHSSMGPKF
ncbi:MAG: hypothetical protein P4L65_05550 [Legionella sp.]|nr:hypothetical protein [Legionella sp.]